MLMRAVLTNSIRRRWIDSVGRGGGNELSIVISDMKSVEREERELTEGKSRTQILLNNG